MDQSKRRLPGEDEPRQAEPLVKEEINAPVPRAGDLIEEMKAMEKAQAQAQVRKTTRTVLVCICGHTIDQCSIGPFHPEERPL